MFFCPFVKEEHRMRVPTLGCSCVGGVVRKLTFSIISVITEDIYLKLRIVVHISKGEPIPVEEVIFQFVLTNLSPFFNLEFSKFSLISLLLLKIFTWNSELFFTIKRGNHTNRGHFFDKVIPLFRLFCTSPTSITSYDINNILYVILWSTKCYFYVITCNGCGEYYIGHSGGELRTRRTVHAQQIRDPSTRMIQLSAHLVTCCQTEPKFQMFPFFKLNSESTSARLTKENYFIKSFKKF